MLKILINVLPMVVFAVIIYLAMRKPSRGTLQITDMAKQRYKMYKWTLVIDQRLEFLQVNGKPRMEGFPHAFVQEHIHHSEGDVQVKVSGYFERDDELNQAVFVVTELEIL